MVSGSTDEPAAAVAEALGPSVVQIELGQGLGSGVIYDKSGLILTNAHVIDAGSSQDLSGAAPGVAPGSSPGAAGSSKGDTVKVRFHDGSTLDGTVLGSDSQADIAVVRVESPKDLPAARLATDKARVGQVAIGIGSPFGLQETVTAGIVSAVDRPVAGETGISVNMLQTDAPINPGNSGGALANRRGEVIGINSAIYSRNGENNGIGFAIPIQTAKAVADKIVKGESLDHGYLGVSSKATTGGESGALLANVASGSPAAKAGLKTGDVVTSVDGANITDPADLSAAIVAHSPGDTVSLEVRRNGSTETVSVQLGVRPAQSSADPGSQPGGRSTPRNPGQANPGQANPGQGDPGQGNQLDPGQSIPGRQSGRGSRGGN